MSDYVQMWKDLGMDLESHDMLCQVLPTAVGMFSLPRRTGRRLWISGIW